MVYDGALVGVGSFVYLELSIPGDGSESTYAYMNAYMRVDSLRDWIEANKNSAMGGKASWIVSFFIVLNLSMRLFDFNIY